MRHNFLEVKFGPQKSNIFPHMCVCVYVCVCVRVSFDQSGLTFCVPFEDFIARINSYHIKLTHVNIVCASLEIFAL